MEGPTDKLSIENETGKEVETPGRATEDAPQFKSPEEPALKTDSGPADKACAEEPAALCSPTATECPAAGASPPPAMECSAYLAPHPLVKEELPQPSQAPVPEPCPPRTPKASIAEMDCLVCFNRYSPSRLPKLLACQHAFCAVCLKLILRNEDHTWIITCPLCRKSTVVFGGLICSLRDKEDVLSWLDSPDPEAEVAPCPPHPVGTSRAHRWSISRDREPWSSRAAAKRPVLLLLLVVMLIALVLPFMYTGLLKWALCSAVVVGLIISGVLCCSPSWNCSGFSWPPWKKKETHVVTVA